MFSSTGIIRIRFNGRAHGLKQSPSQPGVSKLPIIFMIQLHVFRLSCQV